MSKETIDRRKLLRAGAAGTAAAALGTIFLLNPNRQNVEPSDRKLIAFDEKINFENSGLIIPDVISKPTIVNSSQFPELNDYNRKNESILVAKNNASRIELSTGFEMVNNSHFAVGFSESTLNEVLKSIPGRKESDKIILYFTGDTLNEQIDEHNSGAVVLVSEKNNAEIIVINTQTLRDQVENEIPSRMVHDRFMAESIALTATTLLNTYLAAEYSKSNTYYSNEQSQIIDDEATLFTGYLLSSMDEPLSSEDASLPLVFPADKFTINKKIL